MSVAPFGRSPVDQWRWRRRWSALFVAMPWLGATLGYRAAPHVLARWAWIGAAAALAAGIAGGRRWPRGAGALVWAAIALAAGASVIGSLESFSQWEASVTRGARGVVRGWARSVEPYDGDRIAIRLEVASPVEGELRRSPWDVRLIVPVAGAASWTPATPGEIWELPVRIYPFSPPGNPGEFDRRAWALRRRYVATAYLDEASIASDELAAAINSDQQCHEAKRFVQTMGGGMGARLSGAAWRWRCRLLETGHVAAPVALSLLLGQTDLLDDALRDAFGRSGLAHLLAVSGLHVGIVAFASTALLRFGRGRPGTGGGWAGAVVAAIAAAGFAALVGGRPSALRAAGMLLAASVGRLAGRRFDGRQRLCLAAGTLLFSDPSMALDLGFQLSALATASILALPPLWAQSSAASRRRRVGRWIANAIAVSTVAQLGVVPLLAGSFSVVSWAAPLTNIIAVPVGGAALIALLAGSVLSDAATALGRPFIQVGLWGAQSLMSLAYAASPWGGIEMAMPSPLAMVGWYGAGIGALMLWRGRWTPSRAHGLGAAKRLVLGGIAALVLQLCVPAIKGALGVVEIRALDVGQGDAILIRSPWGRHVLIDGGGQPGAAASGGYDIGAMRVVPALKRLGVRRVEAIINTHPHEDHAHGLAAVVEQRQVGRVFASHADSAAPGYRAFVDAVRNKGLVMERFQQGDVVRLDAGVSLRVLSSGDPEEWRYLTAHGRQSLGLNDRSVTMSLEWSRDRFLLLGDAEKALLDQLLLQGDLGAYGLVVPHHGAASSTHLPFLDAVDPKIAAISVGANAHGHPHPSLLSALEARGVAVYRTDQRGSVLLQRWPWGWWVRTTR